MHGTYDTWPTNPPWSVPCERCNGTGHTIVVATFADESPWDVVCRRAREALDAERIERNAWARAITLRLSRDDHPRIPPHPRVVARIPRAWRAYRREPGRSSRSRARRRSA